MNSSEKPTTGKDVKKAAELMAGGATQREAAKAIDMNQGTMSRYLKDNVGGFRDALIKEMERKGIGPKKLAEVMNNGLEAKVFNKYGDAMPDSGTQLKFLKTVYDDIMDAAPKKQEIDPRQGFGAVLNIIGNVTINSGQGGTASDQGAVRGLSDLRGEALEDPSGGTGWGDSVEADFEPTEELQDGDEAVPGDGEDPGY